MDETISLSELTPEHKRHLKLWIPDLAKFVLVYPKKIFWFITKNIPIVDKEKKPIVFLNKNEAYKMLHQLKSQA